MITRRESISRLAAAGIGTVVFHRALAAQVAGGPVTREMIVNAEWVAGITLSEAQRETAVNVLKWAREKTENVRAAAVDNSLLPGLDFTPFASPESLPDTRSLLAVKSPVAADAQVSRPDSDEALAFSSIRHLGTLLRNGQLTSVELTKLYLERLRHYDPLLKCVVTFMDDLALRQAEAADQELQSGTDRGPLHGIPWGLKDIFAYPDYPTTWGVGKYRDRIIDEKAAVAERLEQAGAVLIAKLATCPLAGGSVVWYRGKTRNPWNPRQDAGGSSSGPAAATAAGLVGFSLGTETSNSIIGPASRCGAVGLRPTYGRVSRFGCMQLCWSLDKIGPLCRTTDDSALVLAALHGVDHRDPTTVDREFVWPSSRDLSTIRVGYIATEQDDKRDDLRVLSELGVQLVPVDPPHFKRDYGLTTEIQIGLVASESAAAFDALTRHEEPKGVKGWPQFHMLGNFLTAVDYLKLNRLRAIMMQRFDQLMQRIDVYLCSDRPEADEPGDGWDLYDNMTGHPKVVIPWSFRETDEGPMPGSKILIGRVYDESTLLTVAQACHHAAGLTDRPPLDQFLARKDDILAGEEFPDETRYYSD
ncbi:MAG: amidase [Planctomycetaceae bacterium]|nr:amidase [Planctomycetaceae bacterium]